MAGGRARVVEKQMAARAKGRDDITLGIAGTQGPQPCLETGAGEGGGGWVEGESSQASFHSAQASHPCSQLLSSNTVEMIWW